MTRRTTVRSSLLALAAPLAIFAASPALAQSEPESALDGDFLMAGAGVIYGPSYEGSDDMVATPVPVVLGRLRGFDITPRPGGIALDLIPDAAGSPIGFSLGPVVTYSGNRHSQIEDRVVRSAGKLKGALDVGANAGITARRVLNPYDSLTMSVDAKWNVNDAHRGMIVSPQISYLTPLSEGIAVTASLNARHVDDDYARYYYSVSPVQAARSGLPVYAAKGGWASIGAGLFAAVDLDGDLRNGGLSIIGLANYSRLLNDARRTPLTSLRGDADQWVVGAGIGYTF